MSQGATRDEPAAARVHEAVGVVSLQGASTPLAAGAAVAAERTLALPAGAALTLDMPSGARVRLTGPATARVGRDRPRQLIVARGEVHVQLAPAGQTRRLSLRIATPHLAVELAGHAQAWVGVVDGATFVGLLAGAASLTAGGEAGDGARDGVDLSPGQAVAWAGALDGLPDVQAVDRTLEAMAARGREVLAHPVAPPPADGVPHALRDAIAQLTALRASGERLTLEQRAAREGDQPRQKREVQRALVEYGQRLYRLRRRALSLWERRQASLLAAGKSDEAAPDAARVRPLIGAVDS